VKQDEDDDPPYGQVDELHDKELSVVNHDDNSDELLVRDDDEELSVVNHDDNDELLCDDKELSVNHDNEELHDDEPSVDHDEELRDDELRDNEPSLDHDEELRDDELSVNHDYFFT